VGPFRQHTLRVEQRIEFLAGAGLLQHGKARIEPIRQFISVLRSRSFSAQICSVSCRYLPASINTISPCARLMTAMPPSQRTMRTEICPSRRVSARQRL
jgi:hypothetical protein